MARDCRKKDGGLAFADHSFYRAVSTGGRLPVEVEERVAKRGTSQVQATGLLSYTWRNRSGAGMAPVLCPSPPWENGPRSGRPGFV